MTLSEIDGPAGLPWEQPLAGTLERLVVHSDLLEGNPLGDPANRPLYVYLPPGIEPESTRGLVSVYLLQGFMGQLDEWLARNPPAPTMIERLDAMFAAGECPPAIVVFVDAWTSRGGSQFLNSTSTGRYLDYVCDEVIPFVDARYPTLAGQEHRGVAGKSSGGYGAMVIPMLRPGVFAALASHAGDALFECCYQPLFPAVARVLRDGFDGSWNVFHERLAAAETFDWDAFALPFATYGTACAYSPDPDRPGEALIPFDLLTGSPIEEIWSRWLALDPVRMAAGHADALAGLRRIYLDAGRRDDFFLDLGAQAFSRELSRLGIDHSLELFDGNHGGFSHRYPRAVRELVVALQP
jgi:S-formylglutathione hydrolase FrmB